MKKVLSVLLVMVMVMTLVACGKKKSLPIPGIIDVPQPSDEEFNALDYWY